MFDYRSFRGFFSELQRRNVYKVAVAYLVAGFVVVQVADLASGAFGMPAWFEPMVWVVCALGLPIAIILAWAYDLGPDGVRRTESAEPSGEAHGGGSERRRGVGASMWPGLLAASAIAGWFLFGPREPEVTDRSIAVLPFEANGGDESAQFGRGLHDGLLTRLTNVTALRVTSRTSVQRYEESDRTIPEIAGELDVAWIVEGSVFLSGDMIRVNATLIDARGDERKWARDYEREITVENVFAIQSDLAQRIARSLEAELSPREMERIKSQPTNDLEAHRLYVQGRNHLERRTDLALRQAVDYFDAAIERDSAYARAWSGLADARMILASLSYDQSDSLPPVALDDARRALELDPELAEAWASLGELSNLYLHDSPAAFEALSRATELNPSYAPAHSWLGTLEAARGRFDDALDHLRKAAELDPFSPVIQLMLGLTYWTVEGPEPTALWHLRKAQDLEPTFALAHLNEGLVLSAAGRHDEAIAALEQGLDLASEGAFDWTLALGGLGVANARAGDMAKSREMLKRLEERGDAPLWEAMILGTLGEREAAFRALGEVEWTSYFWWDLRVYPPLDPLRDDPRYEQLLRDTNQRWGLNPDGSLPGG